MTDFPLSGHLPAEFDKVRAALAENFSEREELGMQFCVMRDGEILIDICAGWTSRRKDAPVTPDTLFGVFSSGKAMAALVIAWLAEEDRLGWDQKATTLWPEFAQGGKSELSIAQLMSHQAGLSGITDPSWTPQDWLDWDKTIETLAAQDPIFPLGQGSGYHPVTYGFLAGEIARLADKGRRPLGRILREEMADPFGADVWIGTPESEHARCAQMVKPRRAADLGEITEATKYAFLKPWSSPGAVGVKAWREAELAGSNCHATAKGLATLMQAGVDGRIGESPFLSEDTLAQFSRSRCLGQDQVLPFTLDFAAGVMRNAPNYNYGPSPTAIGHSGWGGSCVWADPETGLHGAYAMNRQHSSLMGDARAVTLINAVYESL